jgi:hypothetical protein
MRAGVSSRHLLETQTNLEMNEIEQVEEQTGLNVDRTFDRVRDTELDDDTEARTTYEGNTAVLEYEDHISPETFAHEAAHAEMMYPDGEMDLPDDNLLNWKLYGEFVAYLAEDRMEKVEVDGGQKIRYSNSRRAYRNSVNGFEPVEEADSLHEEWLALGEIDDREERKRKSRKFMKFQENREQMVAPLAVSNLDEDYGDISQFISPDEELYRETVNYIHDQEQQLMEEI